MKVVLDRERCTGHGRCFSLSPDVFDCDDVGFGVVVVDEIDVADGADGADLAEQATNAAENCPESAIRVEA